jgi:hypothetical protein
MFKFIFWGIVIYLLVRFIFNFVIPVFRATRQMRDQVRGFHERMEEQNQQQQYSKTTATQTSRPRHEKVEGDYIDFEEVK